MLRAVYCTLVPIVAICALGTPGSAWGQEYIVMGTPMVNVRTGPSTDHVIVGRAEKGDIFKLVGKKGDWLEIMMFSGEHRFVFAAPYVYDLTKADLVSGHRMELPESEETKRSLYRSMKEARDRAEREADEIIPASVDVERNATFRKIMEDRIILEMLHIYGFQPAMYDDLVNEGGKSNW